MAGIGFRLTRLMNSGTVAGTMGAFGLAMLIGSGAWLLSVIALSVLAVLLHGAAPVFFVVLTTAFAVSLVIMGPMQMVLSRRAADLMFIGEREKVFPSLLGAMALVALPAAGTGALIFGFIEGPILLRLMAAAVFVVICWIWTASSYVSGSRNHLRVAGHYAAGYATSILAAWLLAERHGDTGAIAGFLAGNMILLALIVRLVAETYGCAMRADFSFLPMFATHRTLALCGLLYNVGLWADKFIIWWWSPYGLPVSGGLRAAPVYDLAVSLSLLSIIPGMATFLLTIESDFASRHGELLMRLNYGGSIRHIREARDAMAVALRESLVSLCRVQGPVTLVAIVATEALGERFGLDPVYRATLVVMLIAMSGLPLALALVTVLFYLDRQREALISCAVFAGVNIAGTFAFADMSMIPNAYGFAAAVYATIFTAGRFANKSIVRIDHLIFAGQKAGE